MLFRSLRQAVADGTIEVIATDHAPHTAEQKSRGLALLSQNVKKGTTDILKLLEQESQSAFEQHKNLAKKKGEEAGTKLLFPMILMLMTVMAMLMFPAIVSFQTF